LVALLMFFSGIGDAAADPEVKVGTPDPIVKFNDADLSLLVSQTGYAIPGVRVAYLVSQSKEHGDTCCGYSIEDESGKVVSTQMPVYAGQWLTSHFWTIDLSKIDHEGKYRIRTGPLVSQLFSVSSAKALYFDPNYRGMMLGQLQTRERTDASGGFIDAGNDIRETNSHVTQLVGILDMLELHPDWFSAAEKTSLEAYLSHFSAFLKSQQQDTGQILGGFWMGSQITFGKWPNHLLGTYGLVRLARHYKDLDNAQQSDLIARAAKAIGYTNSNLAVADALATFLSVDLLVNAEYNAQTGDATTLTRAKADATELRRRQVTKAQPTKNGLYGLFLDGDGTLSRLNYHAPGDLNGQYWGLPLTGLITLSTCHPDDSDVPVWKDTLTDFVEGTLKGTTSMSPMGLVANGEYGDQVRWFSDLFHGMSMTYGRVAADLVQYGTFLKDPSLYALAEKQLLWIGGLNTGDNFPKAPQSFSCIVGHGYRWLVDGHGSFAGIAGSIVNGVSATPQFDRKMPNDPELPQYLCDESWISHTGAWLSGTAQLLSVATTDVTTPDNPPRADCAVTRPGTIPTGSAGSPGGTPNTGGSGAVGTGGADSQPNNGGSGAAVRVPGAAAGAATCSCRLAAPTPGGESMALGAMASALVLLARRSRRERKSS